MKKNITKTLEKAFYAQTNKYFNSEMMDKDCLICNAVPSYKKYKKALCADDYKDADYEKHTAVACKDCPLADNGEFVECVEHDTYLTETDRIEYDETDEDIIARGKYLIKQGRKYGINMNGVKS